MTEEEIAEAERLNNKQFSSREKMLPTEDARLHLDLVPMLIAEVRRLQARIRR